MRLKQFINLGHFWTVVGVGESKPKYSICILLRIVIDGSFWLSKLSKMLPVCADSCVLQRGQLFGAGANILNLSNKKAHDILVSARCCNHAKRSCGCYYLGDERRHSTNIQRRVGLGATGWPRGQPLPPVLAQWRGLYELLLYQSGKPIKHPKYSIALHYRCSTMDFASKSMSCGGGRTLSPKIYHGRLHEVTFINRRIKLTVEVTGKRWPKSDSCDFYYLNNYYSWHDDLIVWALNHFLTGLHPQINWRKMSTHVIKPDACRR